MNSKIIYTNNGNLEKQIRSKKIIPYMIFPNELYKERKWYYSYFYNIVFKVLEVSYNKGELESAYIQTDDGNCSYICTELDPYEDYSISRDRRSIYSINIINHEESFTGAEIVYWFFMNNITSFSKKYEGFWKYVDRYSLERVSDRERYFIRGKLIGNKYVNCEVVPDTTRLKHEILMTEMDRVKSDKYMAFLKEKDLIRMKNKHREDYL